MPPGEGNRMDAKEAEAIRTLGSAREWAVHGLPGALDADLLRCLDDAGLVEVCSIVMSNRQKFPGDPTPPTGTRSAWFSPIQSPQQAGGWSRIRSAEPHPFDERIGQLIPRFMVRLSERGWAAEASLNRRHDADQSEAHMKHEADANSAKLTTLGLRCAGLITKASRDWDDAAAWYKGLPVCYAVKVRPFELAIDVEPGFRRIVGPDHGPLPDGLPCWQRSYVYDVEEEVAAAMGPTARKLRDAWSAATHRFRKRHEDHYYDFSLPDARRVALLAAMTFCPDFDGGIFGESWPWNGPEDGPDIEGREAAWAMLMGQLFADRLLMQIIERSLKHIEHLAPPAVERTVSTGRSADRHPGDDLIRYLAKRPEQRAVFRSLPLKFLDPNSLTVSDADGLIEFGTRHHCWAGGELHIEQRWDFGSVTGPDRKPMDEIIADAKSFDGDRRLLLHVRLTSEGRIRAARITTATSNSSAGGKRRIMWQDVQTRLLAFREADKPYTSLEDLAGRLGCALSTVKKAIDDSETLQGWKERGKAERGSDSTRTLSAVDQDSIAQRTEPKPFEAATLSDEDDAILSRLKREAKTDEQRAKIDALTPEQRRGIIDAYRQHPESDKPQPSRI